MQNLATIKSTDSTSQKRLSDQAVNALRYNTVAKNKLATLVQKSAFTIGVWLRKRDPRLVFTKSVQIISEETGLELHEILEDDINAQS